MGADVLHKPVANPADGIEHGAGVLKDHGDFTAPELPPLHGRILQQRFPVKENVAFTDSAAAGQQPQHGADDGGFAGAGFSHQRGDLSLL